MINKASHKRFYVYPQPNMKNKASSSQTKPSYLASELCNCFKRSCLLAQPSAMKDEPEEEEEEEVEETDGPVEFLAPVSKSTKKKSRSKKGERSHKVSVGGPKKMKQGKSSLRTNRMY